MAYAGHAHSYPRSLNLLLAQVLSSATLLALSVTENCKKALIIFEFQKLSVANVLLKKSTQNGLATYYGHNEHKN